MLAKIKPSYMTSFLKCINFKSTIADDATKVYTLYGDDVSPPVRFVKMTAIALGVNYKFKNVDLFKGENKTKKYTEINPLRKVPALTIGKEVICDSHAIAVYLCEKFDNDVLYPKEPLIRARVQQMLFFNSGHLFPIDSTIFTDFFSGNTIIDEMKIQQWNKSLDYLEHQLQRFSWLADEKMRLCDLCCGATVSSLQLLVPPTGRHPKVNNWINRLQQVECFKDNEKGLNKLKKYVDQFK